MPTFGNFHLSQNLCRLPKSNLVIIGTTIELSSYSLRFLGVALPGKK
jgi:hypothetical protein